jgi:L-fuculose-phosphate aldolase
VLDEIPVVAAEQPAFVGGATPVSPYAPTGTAQAGEAVLAAAGDRFAAVIRNHGPVCLGESLERALACAFAVEESARIYFLARQFGEPSLLAVDEIERVRKLSGR